MEDQYYRKPKQKFSFIGILKKQLKKRTVLLTVLIVIPAFSFVMFSNKGILKRLSLETDQRKLNEKIIQAQEEQHKLQLQSKALDNNPKTIEKVAREKYGMIHEGETVYKVKKEK